MIPRPRRFAPLYAAWILLCAVLFVAFSGMEDPSRPRGRILSIEAGARALRFARASDPARFAAYHVVHVARARKGEGGDRARWVVLLDRVPHTRLREAVVVELGLEEGELLGVRRVR